MVVLREPAKQGHLLPTLGLATTVFLIVGSMIGSGIFRLPGSMMLKVQEPWVLVLVWVIGGFFTITGALTFAELAGMFPKAGGQYVFLRESMGRKWAFLYGWTFFWVVMTGIIAAVAVIFAQFGQILFNYGDAWIPFIATGLIVGLSAVNYIGVKFGGIVNNIFTVAKLGALLALVVLGFLLGNPQHGLFDSPTTDLPTPYPLAIMIILAMLQGFFALDGWPQAAYVSSEVKNATRNVPRAMFIGVAAVVAAYILATLVYLFLVDANSFLTIGQEGRPIAAEAARAFSGETGARLIALAVMVSTFGTVNAYILTSPRIFYALAQDRLFWYPFSKVHAKNNTPHMSILYQGIWAGLLVCLSSFAADAYVVLIEAVVFGLWFFYIPTVWGYFRLRRERPDAPRPYKTLFYPVTPILFGLCAVAVVVTLLATNTYELLTQDLTSRQIASLSGLWGSLLILTGTPILLRWWLRERRGEATPTSAHPEPQ